MDQDKKRKWKIFILISGLLLIAIIIFMPMYKEEAEFKKRSKPKIKTTTPPKKASETVDWKKIEEIVKSLTETGLIKKVDLGARSVWVDTAGWILIDAEMKETLARTIAYHCAHKAGDEVYFADVFDWQSGKKVAKYDALGFKVY